MAGRENVERSLACEVFQAASEPQW
jgi:hypothetical protein